MGCSNWGFTFYFYFLFVFKIWAGNSRSCTVIRCSYNSNGNGREPPGNGGGDSVDDSVKSVEKILEEKRRAELSARIASGEFTVEKSGYACLMPCKLANFQFAIICAFVCSCTFFIYVLFSIFCILSY